MQGTDIDSLVQALFPQEGAKVEEAEASCVYNVKNVRSIYFVKEFFISSLDRDKRFMIMYHAQTIINIYD